MKTINTIIEENNIKASSEDAKIVIAILQQDAEERLAKLNERLIAEGKPEMKWVPMFVPLWVLTIPECQRELNMDRVNRIKAKYDHALQQVKTVCYVDGLLVCADGMHTKFSCPHGGMWSRYFPLSSEAEVAYLLGHQHDNTSRINSIVMYKCNLICGFTREKEIDQLLKSRKITVKHTTKKPLKRNINAISKVLQVYNKYGIKGVELMVDIILEAGWDQHDAAFTTLYLEIGRTLCEFAEKGDKNYNIVLNSMKACTPSQWEGKAREDKPDNRGQHGERPIVDYVRCLCGLIE